MVERLQKTQLVQDFRAAFEGTTGLSLKIIGAPPLASSSTVGPVTVRHDPASPAGPSAAAMISCIPIRQGTVTAAWLQLGPFTWRSAEDPTTRRSSRFRQKQERAIDRREHRSVLRLLGVFALQLAEQSEGLLLAVHRGESPFIEAARTYIATHLTEGLALTQVAAAVHVSAYYFCKRFHESTGLHFTDYVNRSRVARVKERLLNPHMNVSEAAYEAGFQSLSQFNRAFRRVAGEAPSVFRHRLHASLPRLRANHAA